MERRYDPRMPCRLKALVLSHGCHFRSWISDCSRQGLRLQLSEDLRLECREALVLSCDRFGMVHAEVVWRHGETIGMRIRNWQTAAASSRIEPHFPSPLFS